MATMASKQRRVREKIIEPYANGMPARNLTKAELAGMIPCSVKTLEREVLEGRLRSMRIGKGMIRFSPQAIQEWMKGAK
jgi:excisionase family DNA binding protein